MHKAIKYKIFSSFFVSFVHIIFFYPESVHFSELQDSIPAQRKYWMLSVTVDVCVVYVLRCVLQSRQLQNACNKNVHKMVKMKSEPDKKAESKKSLVMRIQICDMSMRACERRRRIVLLNTATVWQIILWTLERSRIHLRMTVWMGLIWPGVFVGWAVMLK